MITPEQAREQWRKYAKYGLMVLGVILAPTIYTIAVGVVEATFAVAAAIVSLGVVWSMAPAFIDWVGNMRMKAVIAVAEANPIETMLSIYSQKSDELSQHDEAIQEFDTQYRNVAKMVNDLQKSDPEESKTYVEMRDRMGEGLRELQDEHTTAVGELKQFKNQIDKAQRIYKVALAMNAALASSQTAQAAVFTDIKKQVAFDTVSTNLNRAFARLDSTIAKRKNNNFSMTVTPVPVAALPEAPIEGVITNIASIRERVKR